MAWRIHDNVIRGEIDNRQRGAVRGKVWLGGIPQPILLELEGNACADLAGCLLTFENPAEALLMRTDAQLAAVQRGSIGDLTASRKVRVFDVSFEEGYSRLKNKLPVPEHLANSLYLEWYSEADGRVVIESADYKLTISTPCWRLTPEEEEKRQRTATDGFMCFVGKLSEALEARRHETPEDKEWDEFDYEKFLRECDARTDKYGELLDKYMDDPDRDRIIAKEMGWTSCEEALDEQQLNKGGYHPAEGEGNGAPAAPGEELPDQQTNNDAVDFPEDSSALEPDPATEGVDWVRDTDGHFHHPLCLRALEGSVALWRRCDNLGHSRLNDNDLNNLLSEYQLTSAKLAGALNSLAYGRGLRDGAFLVACLKRALHHLHATQAALEKVAAKNLLSADIVSATRTELFALREEILRLTNEFRSQ